MEMPLDLVWTPWSKRSNPFMINSPLSYTNMLIIYVWENTDGRACKLMRVRRLDFFPRLCLGALVHSSICIAACTHLTPFLTSSRYNFSVLYICHKRMIIIREFDNIPAVSAAMILALFLTVDSWSQQCAFVPLLLRATCSVNKTVSLSFITATGDLICTEESCMLTFIPSPNVS